jgi:hypothetical protein
LAVLRAEIKVEAEKHAPATVAQAAGSHLSHTASDSAVRSTTPVKSAATEVPPSPSEASPVRKPR